MKEMRERMTLVIDEHLVMVADGLRRAHIPIKWVSNKACIDMRVRFIIQRLQYNNTTVDLDVPEIAAGRGSKPKENNLPPSRPIDLLIGLEDEDEEDEEEEIIKFNA